MNITKKTLKPFSAKVTLGLELGYTEKLIEKTEIIQYLQKIQKDLILTENIYLSVSISDTNIVMSGQIEPHILLSFINYPKFPLKPEKLKKEIEKLTKQLMRKFKQNRIVIEYLDETVMLEQSKEIDNRIKQ
ncbi:hypothetical protein H0I29_15620 [Polaribacter sp. R2A056_3_33]|jgi:hypothetical protein|uniref:hypothetical protein n=1 Tax=Polaribacter sp. R2A056_3_33 TaxID=2745563 RepID=UPI001C4FB1E4|nr:hypothetical protein [Polaribacter sp. R2A056_3_33]QXP70025.1 hypothetical protein H0I29_15620 [Polaribacter sp. R2A056_3_33]